MLSLLNLIPTAWNLNHSYLYDAYSSYFRVISFNYIYLSIRSSTKGRLRSAIVMFIVRIKIGIAIKEISRNMVYLFDSTTNWSMPSVITPWIKESLIDFTADKRLFNNVLSVKLLGLKHFLKRIAIIFQPELIWITNIIYRKGSISQRIMLWGIYNHIRIVINRSSMRF